MIYFLYGPDRYRSREKLREIIEAYHAKFGTLLNLSRLDAEEDDLVYLVTAGKAQSLFSPTKFCVIENIFSCDERRFAAVEKAAAQFKNSGRERDILILWDGGEVNNERLKKITQVAGKIQEFKILDRSGVLRWLDREANKMEIDVKKYKESLASEFDGDLWRLKNELEKIKIGAIPSFNQISNRNIFALTDSFFSNKKEALTSLIFLGRQGEDSFRIFSALVGHWRRLLMVEEGLKLQSSPTALASALNLHPFVVKKASWTLGFLKSNLLRSIFVQAFKEDAAIKIGQSTPAASLLRLLFFKESHKS